LVSRALSGTTATFTGAVTAGAEYAYYWQRISGGSNLWSLSSNSSSAYIFNHTSGSPVLTILNAGNLGLGVTPSAWGSNVTALELPQSVVLYSWNASAVPQLYFGANHYWDGSNWRYKISGQLATLYYQAVGQHQWFNAPSGTSGNTISFTQAMTLFSTGNLLIGTPISDNGARLQVIGGTFGLSVTGSNGAIAGTGLSYINNSDDAFALVLNNAGTSSQNDRGVFDVRIQGNSIFRINNSGNVGIGETTPIYKLSIVNAGASTFLGISNQGNSAGNRQLRLGFGGAGSDTFASIQGTRLNVADDVNIAMQAGGGNVLIGTTSEATGAKLRVSGNLLLEGFQRMYTYTIVVNPSSTGTITISSPTGTNMQGSMMVMAGGYGNGITGNVTGLWMVGGLLFYNNASTSTITQIVNSVTDFGSMSFQRSSDQYTVSLTNTASSGGSSKSFYVSVIINGL